MNTEIKKISKLLRHSYNGTPWYGTPLKEILEGITPAQASVRVNNSHNCCELAIHLTNWRKFAIEKLQQNRNYTITLNSEQDWQKIDKADEAFWAKTLEELEASQNHLLNILDNQQDDLLEQTVQGANHHYNFFTLLHGIIQHDIYHAGQINLLKNATSIQL
jgi:uncharacterized damage-inducible protein DinB